jgi:DNA polymerase-3 subunit epsilon
MSVKMIYIDAETGGPDPNNCALLQLSAAIEIDWEIKEKLDYYIVPYPDDPPITQEATDKHGITAEIIKQNANNRFVSPDFAYANFKEVLGRYVDPFNKEDKFFMVGYNVLTFDDVVLRRLFSRNNDVYYGSWFWYPPIDMMAICADALLSKRQTMPNFQLDTVATMMGVKIDPQLLHNAMYDVQITREIFLRHLRNKNYIYSVFSKFRAQYDKEMKNG